MLDEIGQSGLSPLEVIEYDNQRPIPGDGFQQPAHGPENLFERRSRFPDAEYREDMIGD